MGNGSHHVTIRRIGLADAEALATFYNGLSDESKRLFRPLSENTDKNRCREIVRDNEAETKYDLIAVLGDVVVGWAFVWNIDQPAECTFGIGVSDEWQGKGIGKKLMKRVLGTCRSRDLSTVHLIVVQDNQRAQNLYKQMGFVVTGTKAGADGQDYFTMIKIISSS
ncbi:MAG: hypothetical protein CMN78_03790 [Spirochaetales bacterium]|nr:hypothetical protein [Spirochaetales bacterium]